MSCQEQNRRVSKVKGSLGSIGDHFFHERVSNLKAWVLKKKASQVIMENREGIKEEFLY